MIIFVSIKLVWFLIALKLMETMHVNKAGATVARIMAKTKPTAAGIHGGSESVILNRYSRTITEPASQGASQAMLYATGLTPEQMKLPQVSLCL